MISIVAGLIASLSYGFSDFLGALAAIRLRVVPTTAISYAAAVAVLSVAVLVTGGLWSAGVWFWGAIAGLCAVVGFVTFYAAMSRGPMSLVSPLIAVLSAAVPIAAALLLGERLPPLVWVGVVLALVSATLIASQPRTGGGRLALRTGILSLLSGVSLGGALIALDQAPPDSGLIAALLEMGVGLVLLLAVLALTRVSAPAKRAFDGLGSHGGSGLDRGRAALAGLGAGALLGLAGAMVLIALQAGSLAVVSVLIALYPLATIVLARMVVKERVSRVQLGGIGLAIAASAVIGVGLGGA